MVKLLDYLIYRRMILVFLTQDMSQHLHAEHAAWNGATGFKTDTQIVSRQRMKTIIALTKKSQARKQRQEK